MSLRHDRRRFLLNEDSLADAEDDSQAPGEPNQPRLASVTVDSAIPSAPVGRSSGRRRANTMIPFRPLSIAAAMALLLTLILSLGWLHRFRAGLAGEGSAQVFAALDLDAPQGFGQWFASILLGLESLLAICIYRLRRHRDDDYRGRYRAWVWISLGCLAASLCEGSNFGALMHALCRSLAHQGPVGEHLIWWTVLSLGLAVLGLRVMLEIHRWRTSMAALGMTLVCFALSAVAAYDWPLPVGVDRRLLARESCLIGYAMSVAGLLLYHRWVLLELEGAVTAGAPKKRRRAAVKAKQTAADDTAMEPPAGKPRTISVGSESKASAPLEPRLRIDTSTSRQDATASITSSPQRSGSVLSRAERRKLRRESKRAA